jgi:hypothetical protein
MRRVVAALAAVLALLSMAPASALAGERAPAKHVVLVDWDGFDASYLGIAPTPNLDALMRRGGTFKGGESYRPTARSSRRRSRSPARRWSSPGSARGTSR